MLENIKSELMAISEAMILNEYKADLGDDLSELFEGEGYSLEESGYEGGNTHSLLNTYCLKLQNRGGSTIDIAVGTNESQNFLPCPGNFQLSGSTNIDQVNPKYTDREFCFVDGVIDEELPDDIFIASDKERRFYINVHNQAEITYGDEDQILIDKDISDLMVNYLDNLGFHDIIVLRTVKGTDINSQGLSDLLAN